MVNFLAIFNLWQKRTVLSHLNPLDFLGTLSPETICWDFAPAVDIMQTSRPQTLSLGILICKTWQRGLWLGSSSLPSSPRMLIFLLFRTSKWYYLSACRLSGGNSWRWQLVWFILCRPDWWPRSDCCNSSASEATSSSSSSKSSSSLASRATTKIS